MKKNIFPPFSLPLTLSQLNVNQYIYLALPEFFILFAIGLDNPLSKASSGQAISNMLTRTRHRQAGLPVSLLLFHSSMI